jgi:glycosyltransferase involved in cell wall biosynthesis
MRILLIGEYSRLHNSLKEGLQELGHEVAIVGNGDGFKNFPVDFNIDARLSKSGFLNVIRQAVYRIFKYDLAEIEYGVRFWFLLPKLKGYDIVQLVSDTPVQTALWVEYLVLKKIRQQNKKMFVLSSGTDAVFMQAMTDGKFRYSLLDPYLADHTLIEEYRQALQHLTPAYKKHHEKLLQIANGIIATDVDYLIPLHGTPQFLGMIPNPVNTDKIEYSPAPIGEQVVIFHGINRWGYHKKGNAFFEKALEIISRKYGDKIRIITAESVPYADYIKLYDQSQIVLDQVYAYDQGYNALEAMAKGKAVFTGAETEFMEYYGLTERVAVNALPDVDAIVMELARLIENPAEITAIGQRARAFIEKEHQYKKIAETYLTTWNAN